MDFEREIETIIMLRNNSPLEELEGLSPNQFNSLLYEMFKENSAIKFKNNIKYKTLDNIPLFRIAEEYLKIVARDKEIKLTPLGALPRKVLVEIYDKGILSEELIESGISKVTSEHDCVSIRSARITVGLAGLTKKLKGRITLTKKGEQMMKKEKRLELFKLFLIAYTVDFSWAYNDGYPKGPIGQLGWAFSAFLLNKFGDEEQPANFYSLKYLKALPNLLPLFSDQYSTKEELFSNCYNLRVIKRFLFWFGLVKIKKNQNDIKYSDKGKVIKTNTLNEVFDFDD